MGTAQGQAVERQARSGGPELELHEECADERARALNETGNPSHEGLPAVPGRFRVLPRGEPKSDQGACVTSTKALTFTLTF